MRGMTERTASGLGLRGGAGRGSSVHGQSTNIDEDASAPAGGAVTIDDLVVYLRELNAGGRLTDPDEATARGVPDRRVTIDDLVFFLDAYTGGC